MNIQQQINSLLSIIINAREMHKIYPKDEGILATISQAYSMIIKLQAQQESEHQDRMFVEREIRVRRFRDAGSADYYLMPQNVKIASFDMFDARPLKIATCLLSGRSVRVNDSQDGRLIAQKFIEESVGVVLDKNGDFIRNTPNFKRKYTINSKTD